MVFVMDDTGEFDAPIEKVWKLNEAHGTENEKIHPSTRNFKMEMVGNREGAITSWDDISQGQSVRVKVKFTNAMPLGFLAEVLEGPMAGSKFFNFYEPRGNKTRVTVAGDFESSVIPENQIKQAVIAYLDQAFNEDTAYLKKIR